MQVHLRFMEDDSKNSGSSAVPLPKSRRHEKFIPSPKLKLLEQCSEVFRFYHYSLRTEQTYRDWIKRFILFHHRRHPRDHSDIPSPFSARVGWGMARAVVLIRSRSLS